VHREAEPVAEPVAEVVAEAGGGDRVAGDRVRLDSGDARLDTRDSLQLRVEADVVGAAELVG